MKRIALTLMFLFSTLIGVQAASPPADEKAVTADEVAQWKRQAAENDARACYWLGRAHLEGWTVTKDPGAAFALFQRAANLNDERGLNVLGYCYRNGIGTERDDERAVEYFRRSADMGGVRGKINLAEAYLKGRGIEKDAKRAFEMLSEAADTGNAYAICSVGRCYTYGNGVEQNHDKAFALYKKAAELNDPFAHCCLGFAFLLGEGCEVSGSKAVSHFENAAKDDSAAAMYMLGQIYGGETGPETQIVPEYSVSRNWYRRAAELGDRDGQYKYGLSLYKGLGGEARPKEALTWLKKAAEQGHPEAGRSLEEIEASQALAAKEAKERELLERIDRFDQAVMSAQSVEDLYPLLVVSNVEEIKSWTDEERANFFENMKLGSALFSRMTNTINESKVDAEQVSVTVHSYRMEDGAQISMRREVLLIKVGGVWKTDLAQGLKVARKSRKEVWGDFNPVTPVVESVSHSAEGALEPGDLLEVTMIGSAKGVAEMEIASGRLKAPLVESSQGRYQGNIKVPPGLELKDVPIEVRLEVGGRRTKGEASKTITILPGDGPLVVHVSPEDGMKDVHSQESFLMEFARPIERSSVSFRVDDKDFTAECLEDTPDYVRSQLFWQPRSALSPGKHTATIVAKGEDGRAHQRTWSFSVVE